MTRDQLERALTGLGLTVKQKNLSTLDAESESVRVLCSFKTVARAELKRLSASLFTRHPRGFWVFRVALDKITEPIAFEEFRSYCKKPEAAVAD